MFRRVPGGIIGWFGMAVPHPPGLTHHSCEPLVRVRNRDAATAWRLSGFPLNFGVDLISIFSARFSHDCVSVPHELRDRSVFGEVFADADDEFSADRDR